MKSDETDTEKLQHRLRNAVEFLEINPTHDFYVNGCYIRNSSEGYFCVIGVSVYKNLRQISYTTAMSELKSIKSDFQEMIKLSSELSEYIRDKRIKYYLTDGDFKDFTIVCSEIDGEVTWERGFEHINNGV